jgi:putative SOS response-associated peptidase YedK
MVFAGIWASRLDPETEVWHRTCSIITRGAEGVISSIHDRMPVSLVPEVWDPWLDRELRDADAVAGLLQPIDPENVMQHAVSSRVNSVRNNGPELREKAEPESLF